MIQPALPAAMQAKGPIGLAAVTGKEVVCQRRALHRRRCPARHRMCLRRDMTTVVVRRSSTPSSTIVNRVHSLLATKRIPTRAPFQILARAKGRLPIRHVERQEGMCPP